LSVVVVSLDAARVTGQEKARPAGGRAEQRLV